MGGVGSRPVVRSLDLELRWLSSAEGAYRNQDGVRSGCGRGAPRQDLSPTLDAATCQRDALTKQRLEVRGPTCFAAANQKPRPNENDHHKGGHFHLVGVTGFEPATSSSRTTRATKLRHTPEVFSSIRVESTQFSRATRVTNVASGGQANRTGA